MTVNIYVYIHFCNIFGDFKKYFVSFFVEAPGCPFTQQKSNRKNDLKQKRNPHHSAGVRSLNREILLFVQQVGDQHPSAIFADDDLLADADIELALRRNPVEAPPAGVAFDRHHSQTVPHVAPDPPVSA